jgi:hypothetical protein
MKKYMKKYKDYAIALKDEQASAQAKLKQSISVA